MKILSIMLFLGLLVLAGSCNRPVAIPQPSSEQSEKVKDNGASLKILKMIQHEKQLPDIGSEVDGYSWSFEILDLREKSAKAKLFVFSGRASMSTYELFCVLEGDKWKIEREVQGLSVD